jgi:hypothetical protein
VWVGKASGDLYFAKEALRAQPCGDLGPENFDRHVTVMTLVVGEEDCGHATTAELTLDRVASS